MIWGSFSYYEVSPCFIWLKELAEEKRKNNAILEALNEYREPICKQFWEENNKRKRKREGNGESLLNAGQSGSSQRQWANGYREQQGEA
jgi:hypothetical protein